MAKSLRRGLILFSSIVPLLCSLPSCGYRSALRSEWAGRTLSIPYVKGDLDGRLTAALARQLVRLTPFDYRVSGGRLQLEVTLVQSDHDYIGFRYEQHEGSGELINRLTPDEERRYITAEVTLRDTWEGRILLGPTTIKASTDYDYVDSDSIRDLIFFDQNGQRQSVLQFSLGQLDAFEDAREISLIPLYERLAEQIVLGILN